MTWITGYGTGEPLALCRRPGRRGTEFFLIRALDAGQCRKRNWIEDVSQYPRLGEDPFPVLAERFVDRGAVTCAHRPRLQFHHLACRSVASPSFKAALPEAEVVDIGPLVTGSCG